MQQWGCNRKRSRDCDRSNYFDVHGTLADPATHTISQSTVDSLHALRGREIKLFVATGEAMAFDDGENDLTMFACVGTSVAMGKCR